MKTYTSLTQIREDISEGKTSCLQLVQSYLYNIKNKAHLNALVEFYEEEALAKAREIDQKIENGTAGKLAGMVVTIKDLLCHENHRIDAGSKILQGFKSQFSATAVQRMLDEDVIIIGRTNCDEFAMGSSNENSAFGPTKNEADPERVPGGSSGGSAVAVQADMCLVSLGSDTGGSVRQPAAFCGVIGLKPTYSRISRHGLIAYGSSFDCIGVFSKSIEDSALVLEVIAGEDEYDSTVSRMPVEAYSQFDRSPNKKFQVAYLKETIHHEGVQQEINEKVVEIIDILKKQGHQVEEVEFPLLDFVLPTYYILTPAEASSNLSRYDGVKYGYRAKDAKDLFLMYTKTRSQGFGEEVKRRIFLGTFVLSASYYDAYYTKAQKVRRMIRDATKNILSKHDFIILPTTPTTAFKLGEHTQDPIEMYLGDLFTVQSSVAGTPSISIPAGKDQKELPIGLQIIADDYKEKDLFTFSNYLLGLN